LSKRKARRNRDLFFLLPVENAILLKGICLFAAYFIFFLAIALFPRDRLSLHVNQRKISPAVTAPIKNKGLKFPQNVIASEAKQSMIAMKNGLLRRFAPRNDVCLAKLFVNIEIPIRF
jgi:hypothetical protein